MACILTTAKRDRNGYGRVAVGGKQMALAHRLAYCQAHGLELSQIDGQVVRHTCDNPPCVNPEHLLLGSQADNMQDVVDRGRLKGTRNGNNKLSEAEVIAIRNSTEIQRVVAERYGINQSTVSDIRRGKLWSHIK